MRIDYMVLSDLTQRKWSGNPKDHNMVQLHGLMEKYGFVAPIAINEENGELLWGHGRIDTLVQRKAAGESVPDRCREEDGDWLVPVIRGIRLDEDDGHAYVLADNRSVELGGWDMTMLAEALHDLSDGDEHEITIIGWSDQDLEDILAMLGPPSQEDQEEKYGEPDDRDFWPVINLKIAPETEHIFNRLMNLAPGSDDAAKFDAIVRSVDEAELSMA